MQDQIKTEASNNSAGDDDKVDSSETVANTVPTGDADDDKSERPRTKTLRPSAGTQANYTGTRKESKITRSSDASAVDQLNSDGVAEVASPAAELATDAPDDPHAVTADDEDGYDALGGEDDDVIYGVTRDDIEDRMRAICREALAQGLDIHDLASQQLCRTADAYARLQDELGADRERQDALGALGAELAELTHVVGILSSCLANSQPIKEPS